MLQPACARNLVHQCIRNNAVNSVSTCTTTHAAYIGNTHLPPPPPFSTPPHPFNIHGSHRGAPLVCSLHCLKRLLIRHRVQCGWCRLDMGVAPQQIYYLFTLYSSAGFMSAARGHTPSKLTWSGCDQPRFDWPWTRNHTTGSHLWWQTHGSYTLVCVKDYTNHNHRMRC